MLAFEATKAIKYQIANPGLKNEIYASLNTAWQKFINDPLVYLDEHLEKLIEAVHLLYMQEKESKLQKK